MRRLLLFVASAALVTASFGACVIVDHHDSRPVIVKKGGPPPHAPAHGYRHRQGDVDLVFDAGIGVYVVVGLPHYYWDGRHYLRWSEARWESCDRIDGVWIVEGPDRLPPGLAKKYHGKRDAVPKGHRPPAKHKY
jgi:hypothetical protein